jgi:hypothetical protein
MGGSELRGSELRALADLVKRRVRAAATPVERIAAVNSLGPARIAAAVLAIHELADEPWGVEDHEAVLDAAQADDECWNG